ncbi:MAG: acetyltransferase [Propionibacteriales bacterium]|nr:acetyltransferase [Propionibacteriales bacterium]
MNPVPSRTHVAFAESLRGRAIYVYGAGGHSQVVRDVLEEMGLSVEANVNDYPNREHFAVEKTLPGVRLTGEASFPPLEAPLVLAIGNNAERKELVSMLGEVDWVTAIHPTTTIARTARIGYDTVVLHRAVVQANTVIGNHVLINTAASVDHDNVIEDYVAISPHVTLCGHVRVGEGTFIGAGATVIPNVTIGKWCVVGAGAVVISDIPDGTRAVGVPAQHVPIAGGTAVDAPR